MHPDRKKMRPRRNRLAVHSQMIVGIFDVNSRVGLGGEARERRLSSIIDRTHRAVALLANLLKKLLTQLGSLNSLAILRGGTQTDGQNAYQCQ